MHESQDRITYLFQQFFTGNCTSAERQEWFDYINASRHDPAIHEQMDRAWREYSPDKEMPQQWSEEIFQQIISGNTRVRRLPETIPFKGWFRYAAAIIILCISTAIGLAVMNSRNKHADAITQALPVSPPIDKAPGRQRALLTLSDGSVILLDSMSNGLLAKQGETSVEKLKNGQIVYLASGTNPSKVLYNTLAAPRGGQYQLILPDGSAVWLNAASSITYPTAFSGSKREVSITGEVYFEVAPDAKRPFRVKINEGSAIEVLGTHFNVNAYADENSIKATLLEGKVKIISGSSVVGQDSESAKALLSGEKTDRTLILQPGQQAVIKENIQVGKNIDVEQVVAWKNGVFNFNRLPLKDAMRQLARWYDVEVVYSDQTPMIDFYGKMGRDLNLGQVLKGLGGLGVTFHLEGKKLTVSK